MADDDKWAVLELTGDRTTAGLIVESDVENLLQIKIPIGETEFRTEYYSYNSIFKVKIVSEEIARSIIQ